MLDREQHGNNKLVYVCEIDEKVEIKEGIVSKSKKCTDKKCWHSKKTLLPISPGETNKLNRTTIYLIKNYRFCWTTCFFVILVLLFTSSFLFNHRIGNNSLPDPSSTLPVRSLQALNVSQLSLTKSGDST